jgi:ribonuclease J
LKLTIHRGSRQIGGSCVEIATASTRIILDVGLPLDEARPGHKLEVPGLFERGPDVHGILLSHAHADHSGLLHLTRSQLLVFLSRETSKMLMAGSIFAGQPELNSARQQVVRSGMAFTVGDLRILPLAVDHSAHGSLAFLVEGEGRRVLYSGDLRLHGRSPLPTLTWLKELRNVPVDVLLMEGTHFSAGRKRGPTEEEVEELLLQKIYGAPGLVLASFSPLFVDRFTSFLRATRSAGRIFVADAYAAFVIHIVAKAHPLGLLGLGPETRVFYNRLFREKSRRRGLGKIERLFADRRIQLEEILAEPRRYVMVFRHSMIDADFGGDLPPRSCCLYSYWQGYLEGADWREVRRKVALAGGEFCPCHTSGHIFTDDLLHFAGVLRPHHIVPIHTFVPESFEAVFSNAHLLNDGESWEVK